MKQLCWALCKLVCIITILFGSSCKLTGSYRLGFWDTAYLLKYRVPWQKNCIPVLGFSVYYTVSFLRNHKNMVRLSKKKADGHKEEEQMPIKERVWIFWGRDQILHLLTAALRAALIIDTFLFWIWAFVESCKLNVFLLVSPSEQLQWYRSCPTHLLDVLCSKMLRRGELRYWTRDSTRTHAHTLRMFYAPRCE